MFGLGGNELLIVLVLVLILFGGAKVPQLMKGLGEGMKEFKKATKDEDELPVARTVETPVARSFEAPVARSVEPQPVSTHTEPRV